MQNSFETIVNGLPVLKLFLLRMVIFYYRSISNTTVFLYNICNLRKPGMMKLGQGVEVRALYSIFRERDISWNPYRVPSRHQFILGS